MTGKPVVHPVIFRDTNDPDYQRILQHIAAAKSRLDEIKRFDMPGFRPSEHYVREMKRYGVLPASFDSTREPLDGRSPEAPHSIRHASDRPFFLLQLDALRRSALIHQGSRVTMNARVLARLASRGSRLLTKNSDENFADPAALDAGRDVPGGLGRRNGSVSGR